MWLPLIIFIHFTAHGLLGVQLFRPGAGHLAETHAAPPVAAEVQPDVVCTYRAHAGSKFTVYGYAQGLDTINFPCWDLPIES